MDLSMKWLADYVDCDMPIKDFVSALTLSGSKVECFEQEGKDISNVVVGKVVSMERHPDSDHMFITQVDVGEDEPVQIVTGAQNVHEGDFVPVAKHKSSVLHEGILSFPSAGRRQPAESKPIGNSGIYRPRHRCLSHHRETMTTPGKTISPHCGKTLPNLSNKH